MRLDLNCALTAQNRCVQPCYTKDFGKGVFSYEEINTYSGGFDDSSKAESSSADSAYKEKDDVTVDTTLVDEIVANDLDDPLHC